MKLLNDIKLLYKHSLLQTLRNMMWVAVGLSTPILYLALFTPLLKQLAGGPGFPTGDVLDIFLPGILVLMVFSAGIYQGFGTIFELKSGLIERLLGLTPTSRFALLISPILASLTTNFVFMSMVVGIGVLLGFHLHLLGLLVAFVLLALLTITFAAFSIALALVTTPSPHRSTASICRCCCSRACCCPSPWPPAGCALSPILTRCITASRPAAPWPPDRSPRPSFGRLS